jgi:alkanesulfonate monooxygenase SsuD/methylene tetrahydromethanopterin reductase-like flavin-dependent oxidoreductase (luciferase family)
MRNPIRSETDAFYLALGSAGLIGGSVALGAAVEPVAGVALFAGGIIGGLIWEVSTKDPDRRRPLREAAEAGRGDGTRRRRRVLVVANRTLAGAELRAEIRRAAEAHAEVHVVAPILASRVHYIASDVDRELVDARERLDAALAWAESEGLEATGKVGDPNAALDAIEDELRLFGADEIIISTHPRGKSNWLETGIVERLQDELDIPVKHVVVDLDVQRTAPEAR